MLIPLYELNGNYTVDEIKTLNFDDSFTDKKNNLPFLKDDASLINQVSLENQNELSFNIEDLMKIKYIDCGTWFTACTSQMFPERIFIFGNFFKKVIKITYFEEKKIEIKQISCSNYSIIVLTNDGIFKININDFASGPEVEKLDHLSHLNISKIGAGYDYVLCLTENKQVLYNQNFEKNNLKFLNSDLKIEMMDISTGPSHFFLISVLNDWNLGQYIYNKLIIRDYQDVSPDLSLLSVDNKEDQILNEFKCHSCYLEPFIDLSTKIEDKLYLKLTNEKILLLLELIYTSNLRELKDEEILNNPDGLIDIQSHLKDIESFFIHNANNGLDKNLSGLLLDLINCYLLKIQEISNYERVTKEFENTLISRRLNESCNTVLNSIMYSQSENNNASLNPIRRNQIDPDNDNEEGELEEEENPFDRRNRDINYFQKFGGKGTKINLASNIEDPNMIKNLKIEDFLKTQIVDERYQFNVKITKIKEHLEKQKKSYMSKNNQTYEIIHNNKCYKINSLMLNFKSLYFNNIMKIKTINKFDFNVLKVEYSNEVVEKFVRYLNSEEYKINISHVFEMLELSVYFMIDNLSSLIEIELENIISKIYFNMI